MRDVKKNSARGFSLIEMILAMGLTITFMVGCMVVIVATLKSSVATSQRDEMQQDVRAAENLMLKDISMAGAGLPPGGVALASGTGVNPMYGCDSSSCYLGASNSSSGTLPSPSSSSYYMNWVMPGNQLGPQIFTGQGQTDAITVVYADTTFLLNEYQVAVSNNGQTVTFTLPTGSSAPPTPPQAVNDAGVGLQVGDLVYFLQSGANGAQAVGEVTAAPVNNGGGVYTVTFNSPDTLHFNQTGATATSMKQLTGLTGVTGTRIWMITYYLDNNTNPGTPRLMRKVNGQSPVPVADCFVDLRYSYDTFDSSGNLLTQVAAPPLANYNLIRKVNINMSARGVVKGLVGYQTLNIQTSVSVRNTSFKNRYN